MTISAIRSIRTSTARRRPVPIPVRESELAHLIGGVGDARALGGDLAGRAGVARRHVHDGVVGEEVARPQQQRDGLDGHHGEVLGRRDVRHAERVPEHHVGVVNRLAPVAHPLRQAHRRLARRLGHVPACGPELVVAVCFRGFTC